jgi:hypothetical protein
VTDRDGAERQQRGHEAPWPAPDPQRVAVHHVTGKDQRGPAAEEQRLLAAEVLRGVPDRMKQRRGHRDHAEQDRHVPVAERLDRQPLPLGSGCAAKRGLGAVGAPAWTPARPPPAPAAS